MKWLCSDLVKSLHSRFLPRRKETDTTKGQGMALFPRPDKDKQAQTRLTLLEEVREAGLPADPSSFGLDPEYQVPTINIGIAQLGIPTLFLRFADHIGYRGPGMNLPEVVGFFRSNRGNLFEDGSVIVFYTKSVFRDFIELLKSYILPTIAGRTYRQLLIAGNPEIAAAPVRNVSADDSAVTLQELS